MPSSCHIDCTATAISLWPGESLWNRLIFVFGVLRLAHELLGLRHVALGREPGRVRVDDLEALDALGGHARGLRAAGPVDLVGDDLPVDGERHRLALLEADVLGVEAVVVRAQSRVLLVVRLRLQALDLLGREPAAVERVHLAGLEGLDLGDAVDDDRAVDALERDVRGVAVVGVLDHVDGGLVVPRLEHEGAVGDDVLRDRSSCRRTPRRWPGGPGGTSGARPARGTRAAPRSARPGACSRRRR